MPNISTVKPMSYLYLTSHTLNQPPLHALINEGRVYTTGDGLHVDGDEVAFLPFYTVRSIMEQITELKKTHRRVPIAFVMNDRRQLFVRFYAYKNNKEINIRSTMIAEFSLKPSTDRRMITFTRGATKPSFFRDHWLMDYKITQIYGFKPERSGFPLRVQTTENHYLFFDQGLYTEKNDPKFKKITVFIDYTQVEKIGAYDFATLSYENNNVTFSKEGRDDKYTLRFSNQPFPNALPLTFKKPELETLKIIDINMNERVMTIGTLL